MQDIDDSGSFGALLRRHRLAAGLTQEDLAARAGVSARNIQNLEREENLPRRESVQLLANALALDSEQRVRFEIAARPVPRGPRGNPTRFAFKAGAGQDERTRLSDGANPDRTLRLFPSGEPSRHRAVTPVPIVRNNLPIRLASFVGRETELVTIGRLFQRQRLVVLIGPGGVGKTSLALRVAAEYVDDYVDGVFFVSLASLTDPALVAQTIARTLGAREVQGRAALEAVRAAIGEGRLLLVLDNFEPVVTAAPDVADLLASCPNLTVLALLC